MQIGQLVIDLRADVARLSSDMQKAERTVGGAMQKIEAQAKLAMRALGGIAGAIGLRELADTADSYKKLTAQLKLATTSANEYAQAYSNVQRIARSAQVDLAATAQIYARLSNSLRDFGASQQQISDISETVSLALRVNGATAQETSSAMLQLAQAFGSGRLAGEEFRAVSEAAPGLLRQLSKELGVAYGELKNMAKEGQLTSDVLAKAFTNPEYLAGLREQVKEMSTISSAVTVAKNNFTTLIGEMDKAGGASSNIANAIIWLSDKMALLADILYGAIAVFKQFGRSLEVVFNDIKTFGKIAGLASNVFSAFYNRKEIAQLMKDREEFTKAANEDMENFINGNFTRFRDALKETRDQSAAPYDNTPLKSFGAAVDKTTEKVLKLNASQQQMLTELQRTIDIEGENSVEAYNKRQKQVQDELEARIEAEKEFKKQQLKIAQDVSDARVREYKQEVDRIDRENERLSDSLSRSITDGIFRGFENGKGFFRNFLDVLVNGLKTALVQPFIKGFTDMFTPGITGFTASLFSGTAFADVNGAGSSFSLGNVLSGLKSSFDAFSGNLVGGIEKMGALIANGQGGIADAIGGFMGQYSGALTTSLAFAPAVFSLLKGDTKGALLSGGGAALGSLFGPGGAVIGGAIGSLLGGAFGSRKKNPRIGALVSGTYSTGTDRYTQTGITKGGAKKLDMTNADALGQVNQAFLKQLGGFLDAMGINASIQSGTGFYTKKGKKSIGQLSGAVNGNSFAFSESYGKKDADAFKKFVNSAFTEVMISAIKSSSLSKGLKSLFDNLPHQTLVRNMMAAAVNLNNAQNDLTEKYNITADQAARAAKSTGLATGSLVSLVNKMADATKTVGSVLIQTRNSLIDTFGTNGVNSLPSTMKAFDDVLKGIDKSTTDGIKSFGELFALRDQFAAFTQSIDQLRGGVNSTLMPFLSAQEQQAIQQAELAKVFDSLNMSVPGSLQELIALGKGIDYTTKEGLDLAAVFPQLVQAFQQTTQQTNALIDSLGQLDINKFKTLVDYQRAQAYVRNGISLNQLPSYDVGTPFVPNDGPAMIHRGERILTAEENRQFTQSGEAVAGLLRQLIDESRRMMTALIIPTQKAAKVLERFDNEGVPLSEIDRSGNRITIDTKVTNTGAAEAVPVDTTP